MSRTSGSLTPPRRGAAQVGALALALVLLVAACGSEQTLGGKVVKDGQGCTLEEVERNTEDVPTVEAGTKVGKEVTTDTLVKAEKAACTAAPTKYLTVDWVGATAKDGKTFTSTWEDGRPLTITLGQGALIPGLETGLGDMKVGERREIVIPADQAYGDTGNPDQGIGKGEDLVFVVDLLGVTTSPTTCNEAQIEEGGREGKPTEVKMPTEPPTDKVVTTVLEEGDGPKVTDKSYVTVDYLGILCDSGKQLDSSWDREDPITAALGDAEPTSTANPVIPGWTEGLVGQKQGSLVQLDIPYEQAYGAQGQPPTIGPADPLTFVIKIIEVSDEPPPEPTTTTVAPDGGDPSGSTETTVAEGGG